MNRSEAIDTKRLYTELYLEEGHNYGEVKEAGDVSDRTREQLSLISGFMNDNHIQPYHRVAEIGCGIGHLHRTHPNWQGFEYSGTAVKIGKRLYGDALNIVEADARELPVPSKSFDAIFTLAALEHIPEVERAFSEIERILRPGGLALLSPAWNCRPWTVKKLQQRPYRELNLNDTVGKFLIPVRNSLAFRFVCALPARIIAEYQVSRGASPLSLRYRKLEPQFELLKRYPHISDDDAFASIDAHAAISYFRSRGWQIKSHPSKLDRLLCRADPVIVKKPAH